MADSEETSSGRIGTLEECLGRVHGFLLDLQNSGLYSIASKIDDIQKGLNELASEVTLLRNEVDAMRSELRSLPQGNVSQPSQAGASEEGGSAGAPKEIITPELLERAKWLANTLTTSPKAEQFKLALAIFKDLDITKRLLLLEQPVASTSGVSSFKRADSGISEEGSGHSLEVASAGAEEEGENVEDYVEGGEEDRGDYDEEGYQESDEEELSKEGQTSKTLPISEATEAINALCQPQLVKKTIVEFSKYLLRSKNSASNQEFFDLIVTCVRNLTEGFSVVDEDIEWALSNRIPLNRRKGKGKGKSTPRKPAAPVLVPARPPIESVSFSSNAELLVQDVKARMPFTRERDMLFILKDDRLRECLWSICMDMVATVKRGEDWEGQRRRPKDGPHVPIHNGLFQYPMRSVLFWEHPIKNKSKETLNRKSSVSMAHPAVISFTSAVMTVFYSGGEGDKGGYTDQRKMALYGWFMRYRADFGFKVAQPIESTQPEKEISKVKNAVCNLYRSLWAAECNRIHELAVRGFDGFDLCRDVDRYGIKSCPFPVGGTGEKRLSLKMVLPSPEALRRTSKRQISSASSEEGDDEPTTSISRYFPNVKRSSSSSKKRVAFVSPARSGVTHEVGSSVSRSLFPTSTAASVPSPFLHPALATGHGTQSVAQVSTLPSELPLPIYPSLSSFGESEASRDSDQSVVILGDSNAPVAPASETFTQVSRISAQVSRTSTQTSGTSAQASETPARTSETPVQASRTPAQASETPTQASRTSTQTSGTSAQVSGTSTRAVSSTRLEDARLWGSPIRLKNFTKSLRLECADRMGDFDFEIPFHLSQDERFVEQVLLYMTKENLTRLELPPSHVAGPGFKTDFFAFQDRFLAIGPDFHGHEFISEVVETLKWEDRTIPFLVANEAAAKLLFTNGCLKVAKSRYEKRKFELNNRVESFVRAFMPLALGTFSNLNLIRKTSLEALLKKRITAAFLHSEPTNSWGYKTDYYRHGPVVSKSGNLDNPLVFKLCALSELDFVDNRRVRHHISHTLAESKSKSK